MNRLAIVLLTTFGLAGAASADQFQGVLSDWTCTQRIVKDGIAKVRRQAPECSLKGNYSRAAYGLITIEKHFYKLDDAGRDWALKLLKDTSDKDGLKVVITGTVEGDTIHVTNMSEL